ncbi:MAG: tetratricopeptide repeat protein [bacterium]|nr:tetratricopeptide repeat protein [bacterium]
MQSATEIIEAGDYAAAAHLPERAVAEAGRQGVASASVAVTLNLLDSVYLEMGRWQDAEVLDRRAILIWESQPETGGLRLCRAFENLAGLHVRMSRHAHLSAAVALNNLGEVYRRQGKTTEAERMFRRSLLRSESVRLNNLATLYGDEGQLAEARTSAERAVEIWKKSNGSGHPIYPQGLTNLATLYTEMGRRRQAESLFERAIEIT